MWTFLAPGTHSVTDISGMGLFGSGPQTLVSYYAFRFVAAGTYGYVDPGSGANATVMVPVSAMPPSGGLSTTFTITWSATSAPQGYVFDVQIARPGSLFFVAWKSGVTQPSATFKPDGGTGTYSFRARFRSTSNGAHSGWSSTASIKVS